MSYWWVNQNKTYEHEINGGYMWSPINNNNGARNQFYQNMQNVEPGDVVFSYRKQHISDIGVVQSFAQSASKPGEFGQAGEYWSNVGWLVSVRWFKLKHPIVPKSYIDELRPTLPKKYAPLKANTGDGLQSRKGQGRYRLNLERIESSCRVTGVSDKRFLRASHIKPWRLCENNHERLDGNNGLLLSPNIDLLFDQGFLSFDVDGKLLVSSRVARDQLAALGVPLDNGFRTKPFNHEQINYLIFHRENIFKP